MPELTNTEQEQLITTANKRMLEGGSLLSRDG